MKLGRIEGREGRRRNDGREAAVLVPIIERHRDHHLVFTKRAPDLPEHPGQMSFPGGTREPWDSDPFATATREANEEIGLATTEVNPIGELDDIKTTTEYVIRPYVSQIPDRSFEPDGTEVAEIAVLPVDAFLQPENYQRQLRIAPSGEERLIHSFSVGGYRVWGATGRLVVQLLELTTDWRADSFLD